MKRRHLFPLTLSALLAPVTKLAGGSTTNTPPAPLIPPSRTLIDQLIHRMRLYEIDKREIASIEVHSLTHDYKYGEYGISVDVRGTSPKPWTCSMCVSVFQTAFVDYYGDRFKDREFMAQKMSELAAVAEVVLHKHFIRR